jgi:hypothetical protein
MIAPLSPSSATGSTVIAPPRLSSVEAVNNDQMIGNNKGLPYQQQSERITPPSPSQATISTIPGPPKAQVVNMMGNSKAMGNKQFGGSVAALGVMGAGLPAMEGSPNGLAGGGVDWTCSGITKTDFGWKCTEYARPK